MFTLLSEVECFSPAYIGIKDILIAQEKIVKIADHGSLNELKPYSEVISCSGLFGFPGIIDQHVHIIGGGGENGPASSICEIDLDEILQAGVSTVVGVLGFDSFTKNPSSLLAKAKKLELQGITAYIYTGSYAIPTVTITKSIQDDLILIDKVIGTGEIAISDYRSSQPTFDEFAKLSSQTHAAGLISGKAGVIHIHVGEGKQGLSPLTDIVEKTELPKEIFVPTHVNRNPKLFLEAMEYCRRGGHIDLTAGETKGVSVPDAIKSLIDNNIDMSKVTISSDANGSFGEEVIKIKVLYKDITDGIIKEKIPPADMFALVTQNVAKLLKLHPAKGVLQDGSDADILLVDQQYNIKKLYCKGHLVLKNE